MGVALRWAATVWCRRPIARPHPAPFFAGCFWRRSGGCGDGCEGEEGAFEVVGGEGGRSGDSEAGGSRGDGGGPDGLDDDASLAEAIGEGEGGGGFADEPRDDGAAAVRDGEAGISEGLTELGARGVEAFAGLVVGGGAVDVRRGGCGEGGADAGGEDEAASAVPEVEAEGTAAGDEGALEAEGFAEGADEDVGGDSGFGAEAAAGGAEDSDGVGFVDVEGGAVGVAEGAEAGQVGDIAVHAEVGFGGDPLVGGVWVGGEGGFDGVGVEVGDDDDVRSREAAAVDDGGVVEGVGDEEVAGAGEGGEGANVGGVAGSEEEGGFGVEPGGEGGFGLLVVGVFADDEAGGAGTAGGWGGKEGAAGVAEVVVGAEDDGALWSGWVGRGRGTAEEAPVFEVEKLGFEVVKGVVRRHKKWRPFAAAEGRFVRWCVPGGVS